MEQIAVPSLEWQPSHPKNADFLPLSTGEGYYAMQKTVSGKASISHINIKIPEPERAPISSQLVNNLLSEFIRSLSNKISLGRLAYQGRIPYQQPALLYRAQLYMIR
jgi:hypothetical protein